MTNTEKGGTECQESLDLWLGSEDKYNGDSVLVVGNQDSELKFAFTTEFTNTSFMPTADVSTALMYTL